MEVTCKKWWYKDKNDGYKSKGLFLPIPTLYPCNQLWIFEGVFIDYQAKVGVKHNSPIGKCTF